MSAWAAIICGLLGCGKDVEEVALAPGGGFKIQRLFVARAAIDNYRHFRER